MTGALTGGADLRQRDGSRVATIRRSWPACPKTSRKPENLRQKRHSWRAATRDKHLNSGILTDFDDNALN
jgi:hypothetical protein